jgi:predicted esterase
MMAFGAADIHPNESATHHRDAVNWCSRRYDLGMITTLFLAATLATAEIPEAKLRLIREVKIASADDQRYAVLLPARYGTEGHKAPLLVVLDPRGRALEGLELFRPAAEHYGYVVVSSYESRSDEGSERNLDVIPRLWLDLEKRLDFDEKRVVLAGFSGTARSAWDFARRLGPAAAGIIASGAGLPPGEAASTVSFAYFGTVGRLDFNYQEMLDVEAGLAATATRHHLASFEGGHQWLPEDLVDDALAWLELAAIDDNRRPRDQDLQKRLEQKLFARANALAQEDTLAAAEAWRDLKKRDGEIARQAETALAELAKQVDLESLAKERRALLDLEKGYRRMIANWRAAVYASDPLPLPHEKSLAMLRIESLKKSAESQDRELKRSAERRLAMAFSESNHYLPGNLERRGDLKKAAAVLEVAVAIKPESARAWAELARLRKLSGQEGLAAEAELRVKELGGR